MSIMSYNTVGGKEVITPMAFDIAKLQSLYGASSLNSGDTTYSFNSQSTGYNFTGSNRMFTIWDGGGHDTFDLSGAGNTSVTIDLREALDSKGDFHDYKTVVNNEWVYIAHGANIEDAIGGDGNDTIYGNALDNNILGGGGNGILYGGAGNDVLNGGDGDDRMLFSGNFGNDVVTGAETLIVNGATISGNAVSDGGDLYHLANGMQVEKLDDHTLRIDAPGGNSITVTDWNPAGNPGGNNGTDGGGTGGGGGGFDSLAPRELVWMHRAVANSAEA